MRKPIGKNILDAAKGLFARQGYAETTMDDIAREVAVTKGAIYWHFRNKDDLLSAILDDVRETWQEIVGSRVAGAGTSVEKIDRLFENYLRLLSEHPEICLLLQRLLLDAHEPSRDRVKAVFESTARFIAQVLEEGARSGELAPGLDGRLLAYELLGAWAGCYLHCRSNPELDLAALFDNLKAGLMSRVMPA